MHLYDINELFELGCMYSLEKKIKINITNFISKGNDKYKPADTTI